MAKKVNKRSAIAATLVGVPALAALTSGVSQSAEKADKSTPQLIFPGSPQLVSPYYFNKSKSIPIDGIVVQAYAYWYSHDHFWAQNTGGNIYNVGLTSYGESQMGDIVFVELPEVGCYVNEGDAIGSLESVKTVTDIFSPVSGMIVAVNEMLNYSPTFINMDPQGEGWIAQILVDSDVSYYGLMLGDEYRNLTGDW